MSYTGSGLQVRQWLVVSASLNSLIFVYLLENNTNIQTYEYAENPNELQEGSIIGRLAKALDFCPEDKNLRRY